MTTYAVLLRAINVGGHNRIPMADLRKLLDESGFDSVETYIQSGNIVCRSRRKEPGVASTIKTAIATRFGHDIAVLVRSAEEVGAIVEAFPYDTGDPKSTGVVFLDRPHDGALDAAHVAPDEFTIAGRNIYVNCPTSFAKTKLTNDWLEKQTGAIGTRRNWATVLRLAEMVSAD